MTTITYDNTEALNSHIARTAQAEKALARLNQWVADHGEVAPDDVNWLHVGDMSHVAAMLDELVEFIS